MKERREGLQKENMVEILRSNEGHAVTVIVCSNGHRVYMSEERTVQNK